MANLKGSTYEKQIKDALIRLDARGTKKHTQKSQHYTHSNRLYEARTKLLNDFAKFMKTQEGAPKKLNNAFTPKNIENFLKSKEFKVGSSKITYARTFSGLLKGLENANITITEGKIDQALSKIDKIVTETRQIMPKLEKTGRYIPKYNFVQISQNLAPKYEIVAKLQYRYGFRSSEAVKIANNPQQYIKNNKIVGVKGKGGKLYAPKKIDQTTLKQLQSNDKKIAKSSYTKAIKEAFGQRAHDLRLSYAVNKQNELINRGHVHREAELKVSQEMNHERTEITRYYTSQA